MDAKRPAILVRKAEKGRCFASDRTGRNSIKKTRPIDWAGVEVKLMDSILLAASCIAFAISIIGCVKKKNAFMLSGQCIGLAIIMISLFRLAYMI